MSKNNKGSSVLVAPFTWAITIFLFMFFIVFSVRILEPFTIYQKISETTLKYVFVMEEFGCLNKAEELFIEYRHPFKRTIFDNFLTLSYKEDFINICVSKKGISKR